MRKYLFIALLITYLTGCATTQPYGNFAGNPTAFDQKMVDDTMKQLVALYPPASTRFNLRQDTRDNYGSALVEALRVKGYSILELKPETPAAPTEESPQSSSNFDLHYVIDQQGASNLFRITVVIGSQSITRAYVAQNDALFPAGSWIRKE